MTTLCTMLCLVAIEDLELVEMDVKTAFLHGDLQEDVYMKQPEGFEVTGKEHLVCKLKKSLSRLMQAARQCNTKHHPALLELQATSMPEVMCASSSPCTMTTPPWPPRTTLYWIRLSNLSKHFKLRDLGQTKLLLGVEII